MYLTGISDLPQKKMKHSSILARLPLIGSLLLLSLPSWAGAKEKLMTFAGNIKQFNSIFPQEKVYLQFDNTAYYTGETIWFKAFVVSASTLHRAESKVLYVDLLSPDGIILQQQKLKVAAGQADGCFALLDGSTSQARELRGITPYPSGFYEVRAYTGFMQNFSDDNLYSRVFAVFDKPKESGKYYESSPTITIRSTANEKRRPETESLRKINASFHPEGGHLIIGKPCRVAFRVSGENGLGMSADGVLQDGSGLSFQTFHDGMGVFTFTPQKKHTSVEITAGKDSRTFQLPDAEEEGCAIQLSSVRDSLTADIYATGMFQDSILGITVTCRGELFDFQTVQFGQGQATQSFDTGTYPEGVCRLTLFDTAGNILASRSFYHSSTAFAGPELTVAANGKSFAPFQKIELQLSLRDGNGAPFRDRFSIAVRDSRSQGNALIDDIRSSMLLASDLKGCIEHPDWYFESKDNKHMQALDILCMINGWERYDWRIMSGIEPFKEKHRLEKSLTLNGWILSPLGNKPMNGVEVTAGVMPKERSQSETFSYMTDESGYFGFDIGCEFYGKARLSISANPKHDRLVGTSARILFERSIAPAVRAYMPAETLFRGIQRQKTDKQKSAEQTEDTLATVINIETGYLLPDVEIREHRKYIDYYTFSAYDVLTDVEKELDKGEYSTDVTGYLMEKGFQLLFASAGDGTDSIESINGFEPMFYVHDNRKFINTGIFEVPWRIDTKDIKGIMVYDHPLFKQEAWQLAPLYIEFLNKRLENLEGREDKFDRVILVDILVKDESERSTRKDIYKTEKRLTTISGYSQPYSFYAPEYPDGPIFGDVDYRRTLYWNPNVVTDSLGQARLEFYNSSITGHINVNAAGITAGGQPYSLDEDF